MREVTARQVSALQRQRSIEAPVGATMTHDGHMIFNQRKPLLRTEKALFLEYTHGFAPAAIN